MKQTEAGASSTRWMPILARYVLGGVIVYWLIHIDSINIATVGLIDFRIASIAVLLVGLQFFFAGLRISVLLMSKGIHAGLWRSSLYNAVGVFFSIFLPGGISGDVARAYYFWHCNTARDVSKPVLFGALVMDRVIGCAVMLLIGLGACTLVAGELGIGKLFLLTAWTVFIAGGLLFLRLCRADLERWSAPEGSIYSYLLVRLASLLSSMDLRSYSRSTIAVSIGLSFGIHLSAIALISLFADLLKSGLSFWQVMGLAPFGLLVNMIPLSPGGLGIGEQGFQSLFALVGGNHGGNTFLLSRIFFSFPAILGLAVLAQSFIRTHRLIRVNELDVASDTSAPKGSTKVGALLSDGIQAATETPADGQQPAKRVTRS